MDYEYQFKYIVVGDSAVGKSCLILQFTDERFNPDHDITIGVEFGTKTVLIDWTKVNLQVWDTAGQELYRSIARSYYRGAAIALVVYDITRRETFLNVESWVKECQAHGSAAMQFTLVGNKTDLDKHRQVSRQEGEALAEKLGMSFVETSAISYTETAKAFENPARELFKCIKQGGLDFKRSGVKIAAMVLPPKKKQSCCARGSS